jgi:ABC-type amino acid transport substrate-binding protein
MVRPWPATFDGCTEAPAVSKTSATRPPKLSQAEAGPANLTLFPCAAYRNSCWEVLTAVTDENARAFLLEAPLGLGHRSCFVAALLASLVVGSIQPARSASLDEVRKNGSLHLCANPAAPPYSIRSDQNGLPGFQIELAEAVAHTMGLGLVVDWGRNPGNAAKCDASMDVIAGAKLYQPEGITGPLMGALNPLRLTKPYAGSGVFLAVTAGSAVRRFEDLKAQKIGVIVGSVAYEYLAKAGLNVSAFAFPDEIIAALEAGEVGAGAIMAPVVGWHQHEHPATTVMIPDGYEPVPALCWNVAIGLWRADDALIEALNGAIDSVTEQRLPDRIYAKYGVAYHPPFAGCVEGVR